MKVTNLFFQEKVEEETSGLEEGLIINLP